ncbi:unnamed protein product, partial [Polarella glacialis]
ASRRPEPSALKVFWRTFLKILVRLRYLGLAGYGLEWLLEAVHSSHRLHKLLGFVNTPRVHLIAITLVLAGHIAEHVHQEEENHHQEAHLASLQAEIEKRRAASPVRLHSAPCL